MSDERIASGIVTYGGDGQDARAKRRQIVGSVGAAARDKLRFSMLQDQNGGFARERGDFAKAKFVGNKNRRAGRRSSTELLDTFGESKKVRRIVMPTFAEETLHHGCLGSSLPLSKDLPRQRSGCAGHFAECQANSPSPYPVRTRMPRARMLRAISTSP